MELAWLVIG